jgi:hypothetical protein
MGREKLDMKAGCTETPLKTEIAFIGRFASKSVLARPYNKEVCCTSDAGGMSYARSDLPEGQYGRADDR